MQTMQYHWCNSDFGLLVDEEGFLCVDLHIEGNSVSCRESLGGQTKEFVDHLRTLHEHLAADAGVGVAPRQFGNVTASVERDILQLTGVNGMKVNIWDVHALESS